MKTLSQRTMGALLVTFIIGFGLFTPLIHALLNRTPSASPKEVMAALSSNPERTLLVDIRKDATYSYPFLSDTLKEPNPGNLSPTILRSKDRVFLICNTGWNSNLAVRDLRKQGFNNVYSVEGGIEAWFTGKTASCKTPVCAMAAESDGAVKRIVFTRLEQFVICLASFGLKPLYELMALIVACFIWRRPEPHWRTLRWGLLAFFLGENACAVNYLFYGLENFTWEFWHCYGMLVAFGLISYALVDFVDHQLIHYSQKDTSCAFASLCKSCYKHQPVACNLWILFLFTIPAILILCLMPLSAPFKNFMSVGSVFGADVIFTHSIMQQLYEIRIYPLLAMLFLAAAWLLLFTGKEAGLTSSKLFFSAGLGMLGFSLMRFLIYWSFSDSILWAEAWEEMTEFMFVLSIVIMLCARRINCAIRHTGKMAS